LTGSSKHKGDAFQDAVSKEDLLDVFFEHSPHAAHDADVWVVAEKS